MNDDEAYLEKSEDHDFSTIDQKADLGIRWNSISLLYSATSKIIMTIILARLFTPEEYGIMGLVLIILEFGILFSDVGVSGAVIHYPKVSKRQLSTLYWLTFIIGISIFIILILVSPLISKFYNEPKLTLYLRLTAIIFLITPIGQQFETLFKKDLKFKSIAVIEILASTSFALFSMILAYCGWGVMSVVVGAISKSLAKSGLMFIVGLKIWKPSFEFEFPEISKFLSFGLYQMGERSIDYFNSNLDKILIVGFLGTASLGYYNIAYNLIFYPISLINPIFTRVSFPYFSRIQNNIKLLKEKYFDLISIISFINFPIYLLLFVIAPYFVPLLYGAQWYPSVILVQILIGVGLIRSVISPISSLLLAKGYARLGFFWNLFSVMIHPFLIILGIYFGGIIGVIAFNLISHMFFFCLGYFILLKKVLGSCFKEYFKSISPYLLFSVFAMFISVLGGIFYQNSSYLYQSLYHILIGFIVYLCLISIFRRDFLLVFIKRFLKKKKYDENTRNPKSA